MEMKIWHNGELKTEEQVWADESPYEVYRAACRRLEAPTNAYDKSLRRRWPTLGDAHRAMSAAYAAMPADARAYEDKMAQANETLLALGLI